jgi:aerobic-type carbon monoxide dehydrogenase small subunit (CoxS/CutS family)
MDDHASDESLARDSSATLPEQPAEVRVTLNGHETSVDGRPDVVLCDVLREQLGLTGTKVGCRLGVCGLCTVLVDGRPASSCLLLVPMVEGRQVTTIEGLGVDGELDLVQAAFAEEQGFQCGICTPAQILAAHALLEIEPDPDELRIREWMTGNLCRCTGYASIVRSVRAAARRVAEAGA